MRFRYKLEGFDKDWIPAGNRRIAYYTNLSPGQYRFRVIAANGDGVWNETGAALTVHLQPRFYQASWFYVVAGTLLILLLAAAYLLRIQQIRGKERMLMRLLPGAHRAVPEGKQTPQKATRPQHTIL